MSDMGSMSLAWYSTSLVQVATIPFLLNCTGFAPPGETSGWV